MTLRTRRFSGRGRSSEGAAGGCQSETCSKTLRVQCGKDGVGKRKGGPIAYRATSRRLA